MATGTYSVTLIRVSVHAVFLLPHTLTHSVLHRSIVALPYYNDDNAALRT